MDKITKREMYEAIKGLAESGALHMADFNESISDEAVAEFCENEIALLDKKADKAKEAAAKKRAEGDALTDAVRSALTNELQTTGDIVVKIEGEDVTVAKVSNRLTRLVNAGEAIKEQVTIPGTDGQKSRKIMAYKLA